MIIQVVLSGFDRYVNSVGYSAGGIAAGLGGATLLSSHGDCDEVNWCYVGSVGSDGASG